MKFLVKTVLTLCLILSPVTANTGALQNEIIRIAPTYIGFKEIWGDNRGPEVNRVLASVGLEPGNPWCMALVYDINDRAAKNIGVKNKVLKTGLSSGYLVYAKKHPITFKVLSPKDILLGKPMQPGSTGIFKRGEIRKDGTFKGHADVVIQQIDNKSFKGLDGNSPSGDKGDQGEGDCSSFKVRKIGISSFPFMGSIEVR